MTNSSERSKASRNIEERAYRLRLAAKISLRLEAKMSNDEWNVAVLLRKRSKTTEDVAYLINMLHEYCHSPELGRNNIPTDLLRYVARELKKYVGTRNYKPFPALQGRKTIIDWHVVEERVRDVLEFPELDTPTEKLTLRKLFQQAIAELDLDPHRQLPPNTLTKRIKHFRDNNSNLFEKTDAV